MAMIGADYDPEKAPEQISAALGPQHIDTSIRQAIQFCWMMMPASKRTADELEKQIRRIVDRAIRDFREDHEAFADPQGK